MTFYIKSVILCTEIKYQTNKMKKIDKKLGIALAILSVISCVANYFNVFANPVLVTNFILGVLAMTLAMMETYHYREYYSQNSSWFWFIYSVVFGVVLIANFYATGLEWVNKQFGLSLMMGLWPTILPVLGVFFGDIGRILFKGEPTVI